MGVDYEVKQQVMAAHAAAPAAGTPRLPALPRPARSWRLLIIVALIVAAHAYGWRLTNINLVSLVQGLPNMRHIVAGLLQPDVLERPHESRAVEGQLTISPVASADAADHESASLAGERLAVRPGAIRPGAIVTVVGAGWPASKTGRVHLVGDSGRAIQVGEDAFRTDGQGRFAVYFYAPEWSPGTYTARATVSWPLNQWRLTETFRLSASLMVETLFLAMMGTTLAVIFTLPLSFLGARNMVSLINAGLSGFARPLARGPRASVGGAAASRRIGEAVYYATRLLFNALRSIEVMILVVIMAVVVGIGSFAGVLAIVVHSIGSLGKLYSEAIESIEPGPIEAITATGASPLQVMRYAVVPQVVPQFIAFTLYRWDINVRMSTVVGLVGGGGIGFLLTQYINLLQWNQAGTAIWMIAIVVMTIDYVSAVIRERIV